MAWIGNYIYDAIFGASGEGDALDEETPEFCGWDRYQPSVSDVLTVKEALLQKFTLPFELVDTILDLAQYWPHTTTINSQGKTIRSGHGREDVFLVG